MRAVRVLWGGWDSPESGARVEVSVEEELDGELERLTTHRLVRRLCRTRLQHTGDTRITHNTSPRTPALSHTPTTHRWHTHHSQHIASYAGSVAHAYNTQVTHTSFTTHRLVRWLCRTRLQHTGDTRITHNTSPRTPALSHTPTTHRWHTHHSQHIASYAGSGAHAYNTQVTHTSLTTHRLIRRLCRTRLQHTGDTRITHNTSPRTLALSHTPTTHRWHSHHSQHIASYAGSVTHAYNTQVTHASLTTHRLVCRLCHTRLQHTGDTRITHNTSPRTLALSHTPTTHRWHTHHSQHTSTVHNTHTQHLDHL